MRPPHAETRGTRAYSSVSPPQPTRRDRPQRQLRTAAATASEVAREAEEVKRSSPTAVSLPQEEPSRSRPPDRADHPRRWRGANTRTTTRTAGSGRPPPPTQRPDAEHFARARIRCQAARMPTLSWGRRGYGRAEGAVQVALLAGLERCNSRPGIRAAADAILVGTPRTSGPGPSLQRRRSDCTKLNWPVGQEYLQKAARRKKPSMTRPGRSNSTRATPKIHRAVHRLNAS